MDTQPLVSIVTPCLNSERFIERTIGSVVAQDYANIQYIVMDGGSTDGTLEILERYRGRLEYHSRKHRFLAVPEVPAASRMHPENDTLARRQRVLRHNIQLLREAYGYVPVNWVYGYLSYLHDRRDQFFKPLRHSPSVHAASLALGSFYNYRHLWRYWKEWGSRLRADNLVRAWKEGRTCRNQEP